MIPYIFLFFASCLLEKINVLRMCCINTRNWCILKYFERVCVEGKYGIHLILFGLIADLLNMNTKTWVSI